MCFGGNNNQAQQNDANTQAWEALAQKDAMQNAQNTKDNNIASGKVAIDKAFAGFDPAYYDNMSKAYTDAQTIPLADQYARATDKQTAQLASQGVLGSTVGADAMGQLAQRNATQLGTIANGAADAVQAQKAKVSAAQTNLTGLNVASQDPQQIAALAQGEAGSLVAPQSQPQLGNVFTDLLTPATNAYKAGTTSATPFGYSTPGTALASGAGSSVVR